MADTTIKKWNGTAWEDVYPETTVTQIQASGTPSSSTYLRGDGTWATVTAGTGDIEGVTAGSGLTGGGTSGTVTLSHADTSTAANLTANGRTYVTGLTFDTYGHVTGYSTGTETVVDTNTTYTAGSGLTLAGTTFSHADTSTQASVNNTGRTYIQDITLDTYGHITGITSATETVVDTNTTYTAGSGLTLAGTVFSHADTSSQGSVNNSNGTVIQDVTLDTYGHVTGLSSVDLDGRYLGISAKAADSEKLDGLDSTAYMRDDGWNTSPGQDANTQTGMRSDFSYSNNAPWTGDLIRFGSGGYSLQLSSSYNNSGDGFSFRTRNGDTGTWNGWNRLFHDDYHPNADKLTTARTIAGVSFDGTANISLNNNAITNGAGYITSNGRAYPRRVGGTDLNFNWSGQSGQPPWLWGGSDGTNMYVYNPSNFSVNYATSAGNAGTLDGIDSSQFLRSDVSDSVAAGRTIQFYSYNTIDTASGSQASLEVYNGSAGNDAFMSFHVGGDYAAYLGLHGGINDFVVGGWSKGATYQRLFHDGYHPNADTWTTARTLTVGNTGKSVNGSGNVSWSLAEIGAYAATNPSGYTSNTGTVTSVATGGGLTGGTITGSGTISHADTSAQASVNNSGATVIQDVTLDTYGHVTGLASATLSAATVGAATPNDTEWYYVGKSTDSSAGTTITVDSTDLGSGYDWTNYDYKFVYQGSTSAEDTSEVTIYFDGELTTAGKYSWQYQRIQQTAELTETETLAGDANDLGGIHTGLALSSFSSGGYGTDVELEFTVRRSLQTSSGFAGWLVRGLGNTHYWISSQLPGSAQDGMAQTRFVGSFRGDAGISSVSVNHGITVGGTDVNVVRVYRRRRT